MGDLKLFGYASASGLRIILAIRDVLLREDRVREAMRELHRLYTDAASNPFAPLEPPPGALAAACPSLDARLAQLVAAADRAVRYDGPMPF